MARYVVLIEHGSTSIGASCPDLPGVIAVADTEPEVMQLMSEAIQLHIAGLREDGLPIPAPSIVAAEIQVDAA
jgi:predicted RNase H-like HicB family nuclease